MDELLREFVIESRENLQTIDQELMVLERSPDAQETLASVFRAMHTIKGTAGFFDLPGIEHLAHAGETLLGKLRDGELVASAGHITALLIVVDTLRQHLESIETTGSEADIDTSELVATLHVLSGTQPVVDTQAEEDADDEAHANADGGAVGDTNVDSASELSAPTAESDSNAAPQNPVSVNASSAPAVPAAPRGAAAPPQPAERASAAETSIRVDTGVLDDLMTLMGELVLARNELLQTAAKINDPGLGACTQRINHVTSDLRSRVLKTRMRPVRAVWTAIPRLARDTALSCGKQVTVRMEGEETELDKTVLEAIKDPLTHCVRNSVDHGIEGPQARIDAGKNPEGVVTLRARHENGNVVVEISDDGAGINIERVRAKALEQQLVPEAQLAAMSDRQIANLIFMPGFSTAAQVTNVSGRGVGMDVVRTNAERIGGTADVSFVAGQGTTFTITVPLTLAIIPALVVTAGVNRFAIPQTSVLEVVRADADGNDIEDLGGALVYRLRGQLLPLVELRNALALQEEPRAAGRIQIVIVRGAGSAFGLIVDDIVGNEEIVVRPLDAHYSEVDAFAGATVMGDGKVALILDIAAIGSNATAEAEAESDDSAAATGLDDASVPVLIVELANRHRVALPLDSVARIEKFQTDQVEATGTERVVQYRGDVLPLVRLAELLATPVDDTQHRRHVVAAVVIHDGEEIGLEVERIVEVARAHPVEHGQHDTVTTAIANDTVIDIVAVEALLERPVRRLGVAA